MMKKGVKHLGISTSLVLMVMVVFGTLFSGCYTKDDIPVVQKPQPVPNKYIIEGTIVNKAGVLTGVALTCAPNGEVQMGEANFVVTVKEPGTYTLSLTKEGYDNIAYKVVVPAAGKDITGQLISVNVQLTMYRAGTTNPGEDEVGVEGKTITNGDGELVIPADALTANTKITMSTIKEIKPAIEAYEVQDAAAQFFLGTFGPSGTKFQVPVTWSVEYKALTDYYLANTQLQYRANDNAGDWTVVDDAIVFENNKYSTKLTHFSQYRMVYRASDVALKSMSEELPAITSINNDQAGVMEITKIPYKRFEGAELTFVDGWDGIAAGADKDEIENLVKEAVKAKVNAEFKVIGEPVEKEFMLKDPIKLPSEHHLLSKGTQSMDYYTFTFKVYKKADKAEVAFKVNVKVAGSVSIFVEQAYCGPHHTTHGHCGHIYNGGAGGGMVVGE